jgi:hypothetical protein
MGYPWELLTITVRGLATALFCAGSSAARRDSPGSTSRPTPLRRALQARKLARRWSIHLMSGLALLRLKYPSLLQFEHDRREATTRANLKAVYGVERVPSDTRFRERLDEVDPRRLRPLYKALFGLLQRGKGLEGVDYLDGIISSRP